MTIQDLIDGVKVNWIHVNVIEQLSPTRYIVGDATGLAIMEVASDHVENVEVAKGVKLTKPSKVDVDEIVSDKRFNPKKTETKVIPEPDAGRLVELRSKSKGVGKDCIDNLPFEIKLHIVNYLPLESVKVIMMVNSEFWNVCQKWANWVNTKLIVDCRNVQIFLDNHTLSQSRFSHSLVKVYLSYLEVEQTEDLLTAILETKVKKLVLIGQYRASMELLENVKQSVSFVDMSALFRIIRRKK